jgi:dipeptidyl aminopeptidase/acylaminoacyl peptidase
MHGSADWRVSVNQTYLLGQSLQKNKVPYKLIIYPGANHGIFEYMDEIDKEINNWIESYLLDNK